MNTALVLMLEIQDLRSKAREIQKGALGEIEQEHFDLDPSDAVQRLTEKADGLAQDLPPGIRSRFAQLATRFDRAVVPVIEGTCFGCFVSIASATAGEQAPNTNVQSCESCGRFLYIVN